MDEGPYDLAATEDGFVVRIRARGYRVLSAPFINRGTAFTLPQRQALGLTGLLPGAVSTMEAQCRRGLAPDHRQPGDPAEKVSPAKPRARHKGLFSRPPAPAAG